MPLLLDTDGTAGPHGFDLSSATTLFWKTVPVHVKQQDREDQHEELTCRILTGFARQNHNLRVRCEPTNHAAVIRHTRSKALHRLGLAARCRFYAYTSPATMTCSSYIRWRSARRTFKVLRTTRESLWTLRASLAKSSACWRSVLQRNLATPQGRAPCPTRPHQGNHSQYERRKGP